MIRQVNNMFSERLKSLRNGAHLTQAQLAEKMDVSTATIGMWECGKRRPDLKKLQRLAELFGVTTDYILGQSNASLASYQLVNVEEALPLSEDTIPVVACVRAGFGGAIEEDFSGMEPAYGVKNPSEYRYVRVKGNSMSPKIEEGDLALVHLQPDVESGQIAVVIVGGEEAMIKKVVKDPVNGSVTLISINPDFPPKVLVRQQLHDFLVYGKIVGITRSF